MSAAALSSAPLGSNSVGNDNERGLDDLLIYLQQCNGFDFTGYKREVLARRIHLRMDAHRIATFQSYKEFLKNHPDELFPLFNSILISVTEFFRDPPQWCFLQDFIVPRILARKTENQPIRIWLPGCCSGEEAYSVAMIFAEALGTESYLRNVTVFATDIDSTALKKARAGLYKREKVQAVPAALRRKYCIPNRDHFEIRSDVRHAILFSRHDVIHDPWFSNLDLICCHNTLMYFNIEVQREVLRRFARALVIGGYVLLGRSDGAAVAAEFFTPVNRVFGAWCRL